MMDRCREKLLSGLLDLNLVLNESQIDALLNFVKLIEKWNKAYNLTAVRALSDMVGLHLLDSLAILPHLKPSRIADIGTGAGLPGIPLAICRPDCHFTLIDANSKKTRFVQQAVLELKLANVNVEHARVETFNPDLLFDSVLARAFTDMPEMMRLTRHLLAEEGVLLAMKGQAPFKELAEIDIGYQVIPLAIPGLEAERCLIRIERAPNA
jgi:16S rRNA (guanine527-N7)-methyltransferase